MLGAMIFQAGAQLIATLEVKFNNDKNEFSIPVHVNLDALTLLPDSVLQLVEVKGKSRTPIAYQVEMNEKRNMHWLIEPGINSGKRKVYELVKGTPHKTGAHITAIKDNNFLTFRNNNQNLIRYNYKTVYPPPGIDTVYRRSAFIHPLWSPRGQELTRINAPDHYHHWGLWNPWTHTLFENDSVDFWNLARKQGTVQFAKFISISGGNVFADYKALHEHVVFKKSGEQKTAINEVQSVRIYQPANNSNYYIADIFIQLNCASESPVLLLEYRYGGLGMRATQEWDRNNSTIITSEGKSRKDADGSKARWCLIQGRVNNDHAGIVFMSYPTNYNYPEPLRVWPENMYDRGDVFINFSPTKNMNWLLSPGKNYLLKYRLLVFNDNFSSEKAEVSWQDFAYPPNITVKLNKQ